MIKIKRGYFDDCVIGRLECGTFHCFTLELPDKDNARNISCIPEGTYKAFKRNSPKNGAVIELIGVKNRTNIQIHVGNYTSQIEGCILVGKSITYMNKDSIPDVTDSRNTLIKLLDLLPKDNFTVEIT
jgi:hypothetical protein